MSDEEDFGVTRAGGDAWGFGVKHRSLTIKRCANGYTVDYQIVSKTEDEEHNLHRSTVNERRVFITNADLFEFAYAYFADEPKPEPRRKIE